MREDFADMTERVLCLSGHPDDESFGCGGTLAKHAQAGDPVSVVAFTNGVGARGFSPGASTEREVAFRQACKILGTEDVWIHDYADNQMDEVPQLTIVQQIEKHIERFKPTIVYTHSSSDVNVDHRVMHECTVTACRSQPGHCVKHIRFFEVPSSTEWQMPGKHPFQPNLFVDVTSTFELKLRALDQYATEMRDYPHPRSYENIEHLARWRGGTIGVNLAEAFVVGREIQ